MKNLKSIFLLLMITLFVTGISSCRKDKNEETPTPAPTPTQTQNLADVILGTWVTSNIEGTENYTENDFVCSYNSDNTGMYAYRTIVGNNSSWEESTSHTYSIEDNILVEDIVFGNDSLRFKSQVTIVDDNTLNFKELEHLINGVEDSELLTYTMKKNVTDYSNDILGLWYEEAESSTYEFLPNNIVKTTTDGELFEETYFLYGDFLTWNYEETINDELILMSESYFISIENDTMTFVRKLEEGMETTYAVRL